MNDKPIANRFEGCPHHVFISYRRDDVEIADSVRDSLLLRGLRVWYDRAGAMAGRPFVEGLYKAVRDAPWLCVVVTLGCLKTWAYDHDPGRPDFMLTELLVALHFQLTEGSDSRHVFPLFVGPRSYRSGVSGSGERERLQDDPLFAQYLADMPDVVPAASIELASTMLLDDGGQQLHPALRSITVRELMLGRKGMKGHASDRVDGGHTAVQGLLEIMSITLWGPDEHAGLILTHRYASCILNALHAGKE